MSYDNWKATNPTDAELGNAGEDRHSTADPLCPCARCVERRWQRDRDAADDAMDGWEDER